MEKKIITEEPNDDINDEMNALSNNKVGVDIDPNVKSNNVNLQICSCSIVFNCLSSNIPDSK